GQPLLKVRGLTRLYGVQKGCQDVSFDLYPGEWYDPRRL
ncbi:phosphonate C-P lyase system protein PhnK, partial [Pseudomonas syringae pv. japonica str. M301072]